MNFDLTIQALRLQEDLRAVLLVHEDDHEAVQRLVIEARFERAPLVVRCTHREPGEMLIAWVSRDDLSTASVDGWEAPGGVIRA